MTSSPGLRVAIIALKMICLPPTPICIWSGEYLRPFSRSNLRQTASRSSGMPGTGGYFVLPSRIALIAASWMNSGVLKSGSPAPRPITSSPAAFISRALSVTAMVGDVLTRLIREAIYDITRVPYLSRGVGRPRFRSSQSAKLRPWHVGLNDHWDNLTPGWFGRQYFALCQND